MVNFRSARGLCKIDRHGQMAIVTQFSRARRRCANEGRRLQRTVRVGIEEVPDPEIKHPNDAIVRITSSCICGSDLHMYEGRTAAEPGIVFGHENMGVIEEVGSAVKTRRVGDRVVLPFNVACGFCKNCLGGFTGFCTTVNPGFAGGAYGYVAMGPWVGGQAEYLQVPFVDFNALPLPAGDEHEADFPFSPISFRPAITAPSSRPPAW